VRYTKRSDCWLGLQLTIVGYTQVRRGHIIPPAKSPVQPRRSRVRSSGSHLTERLSGTEDGKPKVFRDSAVENLGEFFQRFRTLNVRSSAELDQLVDEAQQIVRGIQPQTLRDNGVLRQQLAAQLSGVQSVLDGLLVDRPRRNILRSRQEQVA
jgi:hypothetical protein